jgi:putative DNA primase/helicase
VYQAGKPVTIHRTFLTTDVPQRKMLMPHDGPKLSGCYIPLSKKVYRIAHVGEGIETVLAAAQLNGRNHGLFACVAADQMERFVPPDWAECVHIYGDNDASYTGQAAAYRLAKNCVTKEIPADVFIPEAVNTDWNDILLAHLRTLKCIA